MMVLKRRKPEKLYTQKIRLKQINKLIVPNNGCGVYLLADLGTLRHLVAWQVLPYLFFCKVGALKISHFLKNFGIGKVNLSTNYLCYNLIDFY